MKSIEMMSAVGPPVSRRNPAGLLPHKVNRAAFGPFCDEIRRLACLTPTQKDVACLLAEATLMQGFTSLPVRSLEALTELGQGMRPFAGLGKNDLSLAINGGMVREGRLQHGLRHFRILVVDERGPLERGIDCRVLTVVADATQWAVDASAWRFAPQDRVQWLENVSACRRAFTAHLRGLVPDADLLDARAAVAAESVSADALDGDDQDRTACRVGRVSPVDALGSQVQRMRGVPAACRAGQRSRRSDSRNAKTAENAGLVPTFGTDPVKQFNSLKQKTVQPLNCLKDDSNRLLAMLAEQFERVHGAERTSKEMASSGANWRMIARRWPDEFERQVAALRIFLNEGGKIKTTAWFYFHYYFSRAIGCTSWDEVCKKSKGIF